MTQEQFTNWLDRHQVLFPTVAEWLASRGKGLRTVLKAWYQAMAHIKFDRATKITADMVAGVIPHPDRWSIERLPAAMVAAAPPKIPALAEVNRP